MRLEIKLPGWSVWLRCWQAQVGRCKLYLLDSNDAANYPAHRGITSELYGGNTELRLKQEIILGIAGWSLLEELDIHPEVCHLNEGHAAFAVLERAHCFMKKTRQPFDVALTATRAGNIFTTHTAVNEGFDRFSPSLVEEYLGLYAQTKLGISIDRLLSLGRCDPGNSGELFNMAYLAIRASRFVNAVSQLHAQVSRAIFEPLFSRWPQEEVPIGYITNGVHMPSWDSEMADAFWTNRCGKCRWLGMPSELGNKVRQASDEEIWRLRTESRKKLIEYARALLSRQLAARGAPAKEIEQAECLFDFNTLTLGFARRFVPYKRPNLLLYDVDRLKSILTNADRPVQLFVAGKAHPADQKGKRLIQEWLDFIHTNHIRAHVIFLADYDMLLTENLVQGVDVWLNTPRRPWEASGTSGMKTLVNGGLNCSELDGWWAEAYSPEVGWAIGDGREHPYDDSWDGYEARELYDLLEQKIIPLFYKRNVQGFPAEWINRIRESMARLTPRFSASRTVSEYVSKYYIPAAAEYLARAENNGALSIALAQFIQDLHKNWPQLRFVHARVVTKQDVHHFEVVVDLSHLSPDMVKVELFSNEKEPLRKEMTRDSVHDGSWYTYRVFIPATYEAINYTPRITACHSQLSLPLEGSWILWQK
jgi:starch phosphorylase